VNGISQSEERRRRPSHQDWTRSEKERRSRPSYLAGGGSPISKEGGGGVREASPIDSMGSDKPDKRTASARTGEGRSDLRRPFREEEREKEDLRKNHFLSRRESLIVANAEKESWSGGIGAHLQPQTGQVSRGGK